MAAATDSSAGFQRLRGVRWWMSQRGTDPQSEYGGKSCSAVMGFWLSIAILMKHRDPEAQRIQGSKPLFAIHWPFAFCCSPKTTGKTQRPMFRARSKQIPRAEAPRDDKNKLGYGTTEVVA